MYVRTSSREPGWTVNTSQLLLVQRYRATNWNEFPVGGALREDCQTKPQLCASNNSITFTCNRLVKYLVQRCAAEMIKL